MGRTHIFNASLVWMLPALEQRTGLVRGLLGDWEIATIVGAASGQPMSAYVGFVPGVGYAVTGTGRNGLYALRTGAPCQVDGGLPEQIINPAAYTLNGYRLGTNGTARRGDCTGPDYFQADLAFYKNIRLRGRLKLQFRWDIFNLFNNTNFLVGSVNSYLNPTATTLDAPLESATTIVDAPLPANFGQATGTRDARQMQLGVKLVW
jgi:hypothetical protein